MLNEIKAYLERYKQEVFKEANRLRDQQMPLLTEELFSIYETSGNRLQYESVYFNRRKYLATFGLASIIGERAEDIQKLEEIISQICEEECWALPAHVNRQQNSSWRMTIDLFAAETAQALAEIITILEQQLSGKIKNKVKEEAKRRVLEPYGLSKIPYSSWEQSKHNWCAVCCGAIGSASIYLLKDEPIKLEYYIKRISEALVNYYLEGFGRDGACMEGLGYFTYGMTYYIGFAEQVYRYTEGKMNLLDLPKCEKIATFQQKCFFRGGRTISFSDGDSQDYFKMGLSCYLAMHYPSVTVPPIQRAGGFHSDTCYRWMSIYRDYIWVKGYIDELEEKKDLETNEGKNEFTHIVLPEAEWSICENSNGIGVAIKGGHNDEPHNHNDIGSFVYINGREVILSDLGAGEYTRDYFSNKRYTILCNRSLGHNVPIINGREQEPGSCYKCDRFEADHQGKTEISFPKAYKDGVITGLIREIIFDRTSGAVVVEDTFQVSSQTTSIQENLVTEWLPEIKGNRIIIKAKEGGAYLTLESCENVSYYLEDHMDHSGNLKQIYRIQWDVPIIKNKVVCKIYIEPFKKAIEGEKENVSNKN